MSWLSIPLPNPFKSLQSEDPQQPIPSPSSSDQNPSHAGGVKEDLSVLGETIGRQLRGVAAFLAPPPPPPPSSAAAEDTSSDSSSQTLLGIRNDLVEIGGSFKSGLSLLSGNKAVSEISRFASNLLQFQNEDDDDDEGEDRDEVYEGVAGITEEVLNFARKVSMRPECWIDFPLSLNNEFHMSDAQREHASTIEHLAPSVAVLRLKLCSYMSDEHFWMIYFILLLPRLNEHDSKLLSTPQIIEARDILLHRLQNKRSAQVNSENSKTADSSQAGSKVSETLGETSPSQETEVLAETVNAAQGLEVDKQENIEQWLEEEDVDTGTSLGAQKQLENEEDVSFSDLEDDDNDLSSRRSGFRPAEGTGVSSPDGSSNEWVQLNESSETRGGLQKAGQSISREKDSEGEEPNDWLTVDDFD